MAYICELGTGRTLYLDSASGQTTVSITSTLPGQQQQATSRFQTGNWTATPEVYLTRDGAVIKLQAERGAHYIRVHGNSIGVSEAFSLEALEQLQMQQISGIPATGSPPLTPPLPPLPGLDPLPPMTMGDMQMSMNPMEMRMGNMELRMGMPAEPTEHPEPPANQSAAASPRFCGQCGAATKPGDRFCTHCGQRLGD